MTNFLLSTDASRFLLSYLLKISSSTFFNFSLEIEFLFEEEVYRIFCYSKLYETLIPTIPLPTSDKGLYELITTPPVAFYELKLPSLYTVEVDKIFFED